ncbi:hypothetical protein BS17DRAFT_811373 [Gyrodon lividus]|nr:hypothetical protein BS17DRAFT_811373 [Gyrodon lividus]
MQEHNDLFKVPKIFFEDTELNEALKKLVTDMLTSCQGRIKAWLIKSLHQRTSIMDVLRALSMGNMEINATHWTRLSFIRFCLWIFLIGTRGFNKVSFAILFTPNIVNYLHPDLYNIIEDVSGLSVEALTRIQQPKSGDENDDEASLGDADAEGEMDDEYWDVNVESGSEEQGGGADDFEDQDEGERDYHDEYENEGEDNNDEGETLNDRWSGFGTACLKWTSKKFWAFVDDSLEQCRRFAKENSTTTAEYENVLGRILTKINKLLKDNDLLNTMAPASTGLQWQDTIQQELLW